MKCDANSFGYKIGSSAFRGTFCIGIAFYGFARLSMADKENRVDILNLFLKTVRVFLKRITLIILCMSFRRLHILPNWIRFIVRA